ncbi:GPR endopeptidase [Anaerovorax odorimutans]|uniref:Germination protease n=1 Tax=Anaerovorax odorimutans TaxID=109327 RepID=A0ABT1RM25_9FIRM|nr:GPR endopeptidase [Anaerovorax odorimutans]
MKYRTDLAIERKELLDEARGSAKDIEGVSMEKIKYDEDITSTRIKILNPMGEIQLEKPMGNYITIEVNGILDEKDEIKERAGKALAKELSELIKFHYHLKVLVVGLGNDKVTPDALGPYTVSKVKVTRHFFIMYEADGDEELGCVSCFIPGVTGSTGMETAELIKGAVELCDPEVVIVVDSLAARNIDRVSTTIQINDTGIDPGGGMGNVRTGLSEQTLGRRVIAIGVPTVIDSRTIIREALEANLPQAQQVDDYIEEKGQDMIVTSTDIDQIIKDFSDIIANGINKTLHPGIYS